MLCPKCNAQMDVLSIEGVELDRCVDCRGLWFDYLELEKLEGMAAAVALEEAPNEHHGHLDEMVYVECPRCFKILDQETRQVPRKIRYEICRTCGGAFFDAGEFVAATTS